MLFSESLEEYKGPLPEKVSEALEEIRTYYSLKDLKILSFSESQIAIPVIVSVALPPVGPLKGIDIRHKEQVLIRINILQYPEVSPLAMSDRMDFPRHKLSHLYAGPDYLPTKLCIVRGNPDEWFARNRMENFLDVITEWLFKAGNGLLNEDGDEFDPLRQDNYQGYHFYRYDRLKQVIDENMSFVPGAP